MDDTRPHAGAADYVTLLQRRILTAVDDGRDWAKEAYERGYQEGYKAGYLDARTAIKRIEHALYRAFGGRR